MKISLKNKKALVGGSSGGIGKAIAQQLAASGASVTLMARNEDKLKVTLGSLDTSEGQSHQYLVVDFSDYEEYKKIISKYFESNTVDILVNNTQGPSAGNALEKNVDDYQDAFDLLFKTVVFTTELALLHMIQNQWGRVINVILFDASLKNTNKQINKQSVVACADERSVVVAPAEQT